MSRNGLPTARTSPLEPKPIVQPEGPLTTGERFRPFGLKASWTAAGSGTELC
jgi:hypothetical protein